MQKPPPFEERDLRKKAGLGIEDIDGEDEHNFMGVGPLIEKLEKDKLEDTDDLHMDEEPTDSKSDDDDDRFTAEAVKKRADELEKIFKRHGELLKIFTEEPQFFSHLNSEIPTPRPLRDLKPTGIQAFQSLIVLLIVFYVLFDLFRYNLCSIYVY